MMKLLWVLALLLGSNAEAVTVKSRPCAGGVEAAKIRVEVIRPQGGDPRSLQHIKRIEKGSRIVYKPVDLPQDVKTTHSTAARPAAAQSHGPVSPVIPANSTASIEPAITK